MGAGNSCFSQTSWAGCRGVENIELVCWSVKAEVPPAVEIRFWVETGFQLDAGSNKTGEIGYVTQQ